MSDELSTNSVLYHINKSPIPIKIEPVKNRLSLFDKQDKAQNPYEKRKSRIFQRQPSLKLGTIQHSILANLCKTKLVESKIETDKSLKLLFQSNAIFFCPFNKTYTILTKDKYKDEQVLQHIMDYKDNNFFLIQINNNESLYKLILKEHFKDQFQHFNKFSTIKMDYCFPPIENLFLINLGVSSIENTGCSINKSYFEIFFYYNGIYLINKNGRNELLNIFCNIFNFKECKDSKDFFHRALQMVTLAHQSNKNLLNNYNLSDVLKKNKSWTNTNLTYNALSLNDSRTNFADAFKPNSFLDLLKTATEADGTIGIMKIYAENKNFQNNNIENRENNKEEEESKSPVKSPNKSPNKSRYLYTDMVLKEDDNENNLSNSVSVSVSDTSKQKEEVYTSLTDNLINSAKRLSNFSQNKVVIELVSEFNAENPKKDNSFSSSSSSKSSDYESSIINKNYNTKLVDNVINKSRKSSFLKQGMHKLKPVNKVVFEIIQENVKIDIPRSRNSINSADKIHSVHSLNLNLINAEAEVDGDDDSDSYFKKSITKSNKEQNSYFI